MSTKGKAGPSSRVAVTKGFKVGNEPKLGSPPRVVVRRSRAPAPTLLLETGEAVLGMIRRKEMRRDNVARMVFMVNRRWLMMMMMVKA